MNDINQQRAQAILSRWSQSPDLVLDLIANRCGLTLRCKCTVDTIHEDIVKLGLGERGELGSLSFSTRNDILVADGAGEPESDRDWLLICSAEGRVCSFLQRERQ